jgi:hypothetical protein
MNFEETALHLLPTLLCYGSSATNQRRAAGRHCASRQGRLQPLNWSYFLSIMCSYSSPPPPPPSGCSSRPRFRCERPVSLASVPLVLCTCLKLLQLPVQIHRCNDIFQIGAFACAAACCCASLFAPPCWCRVSCECVPAADSFPQGVNPQDTVKV